jgi:hypothetical protein
VDASECAAGSVSRPPTFCGQFCSAPILGHAFGGRADVAAVREQWRLRRDVLQ